MKGEIKKENGKIDEVPKRKKEKRNICLREKERIKTEI